MAWSLEPGLAADWLCSHMCSHDVQSDSVIENIACDNAGCCEDDTVNDMLRPSEEVPRLPSGTPEGSSVGKGVPRLAQVDSGIPCSDGSRRGSAESCESAGSGTLGMPLRSLTTSAQGSRRGSADSCPSTGSGTLGMPPRSQSYSVKDKFRTKSLTIVDENHYAMFLHSVVLVGWTAPQVAKQVEEFAESQKKTGLGQYDNGVAVLCSWEIPECEASNNAVSSSGGRASVIAEEAAAGRKWSRLRIETRDYSFKSSFPDMQNIEQASNTAFVFLVEQDADISDIKSKMMEANIQRHVPLMVVQPVAPLTLDPVFTTMKQLVCLSPVDPADPGSFYRQFCEICERLSQNRAKSQSAALVFHKAVAHKVQSARWRRFGCCRRRRYQV